MNARHDTEAATGLSGPDARDDGGELPGWALAAMIILGWALMFGGALGSVTAFSAAMLVVLTDGIMAALVLLAATGYGRAIFRFVAPGGSPRLLALATSAAVGLWLLSTAVLVVGSLIPGALTMFVWWPVVGVGAGLAVLQAHRALGRARIPSRFGGGSLVWVVTAMAAGLWLAGAVLPPGWLGNLTADAYDILEYHVQLPREYYYAGLVRTLDHNVYSHYPLGVEMLFLLGMCLRGGAYEGMYLAKLMSGLFGLVAVVGVFGALKGPGIANARDSQTPDGQEQKSSPLQDFRARATVVLLATAPWVIYLSGLALAELAQLCHLALALLWLRHWLNSPSARAAGWIGAMLGAACAVKYLSVGLIAAPVLAVMLAAGARQRSPNATSRVWSRDRLAQAKQNVCRLRHAVLAAALAGLAFSPWLIRNLLATGNPVFPLAAGLFGRGHWSEESARRWRDGHAPGYHDPVPVPPDHARPAEQPSRRERLAATLLGQRPYHTQPALTAMVLVVVLATVFAMFIRPRAVPAWDWALLAVLAIQMLVWALFTRDMPARFISIAVAPISMLSAGGLARLAGVREFRWMRQKPGAGGRWGMAPAVLVLAATAGLNLLSARAYYRSDTAIWRGPPGREAIAPAGLPGRLFAEHLGRYAAANRLGEGVRVMLIGEARGFYFPAGSIYATVFDEQPLAAAFRRGASAQEVASLLRGMGVTHVFVAWTEIARLTRTYGWPAEMRLSRLQAAFAGWPVVEQMWDRMTASGPAAGARRIFTLYALPETAG